MILYVRNTKKEAVELIKALELLQQKYMPIGVGGPIAGHGFDKIIFDVDIEPMSMTQLQRYHDWKRNIETKLNNPKTGKIIKLQ